MNTLNKNQTSNFYIVENGFNILEQRWAEFIQANPRESIAPEAFMLYAILRGKDWRKCFSNPKNPDPSWNHPTSPRITNIRSFCGWRQLPFTVDDIIHLDYVSKCIKTIPSGYGENDLLAIDAYPENFLVPKEEIKQLAPKEEDKKSKLSAVCNVIKKILA